MSKRQLKVFRVQPEAYQRFVEKHKDAENRSEQLRAIVSKACDNPPVKYPVRKIKADLVAFSVFIDKDEHDKLVKTCEAQGVSKNIFLEAAFNELA